MGLTVLLGLCFTVGLAGLVEEVADRDVAEIERHFAVVDLGHVEDVVDGPRELGRRGPHRGHMGARPLGQGVAGMVEQFRIADDGGERGP